MVNFMSLNHDLYGKDMELISNYNPDLKYSDPELVDILDNFLLYDVFENCTLSTRSRLLVTLATLIANQSLNQYSEILIKSLDLGINPIEIKEVLYQSLPYIGLAKTYDFLNKTNDLVIHESNLYKPKIIINDRQQLVFTFANC